ncbi:response regulator transcription factor [Nitrospirillum sp. BR 11752]|uniref:LuxR family two component transcriptional regulator n=1 Tax=Nitrospirillum amazonense TaxID=28077 RepID=A0A560GUV6_9PROT|nr:response regulator transcription factor [Nitrospirillum amazonense]MEE3627661.1 response regulator transcription factor [Nitrospirillum sp. BR 11752]TWB37220.1 LuxR family two component transcriptional regulator [Nitrospirillum amazonense]
MPQIIIADDHPMVRGALTLAVEAAFDQPEILECAHLGAVMQLLESIGAADLLLLDLRMPGVDGFEGLVRVRSQFPATPVVVISALEDPRLVREALALGAMGFIPKSTPRAEIVAALSLVAGGGTYRPDDLAMSAPPPDPKGQATDDDFLQRVLTLTPQQRRVLQLLGTGKLNKEIAYDLDIAETTVKAHVSSILHKLRVYSRTQAVVMAGRLHLDSFADVAEG